MTTYYKFLRNDDLSPYMLARWQVPYADMPGYYMELGEPLYPNGSLKTNGFHLCDEHSLLDYAHDRLYLAEFDEQRPIAHRHDRFLGEMVHRGERARLIRPLHWGKKVALTFLQEYFTTVLSLRLQREFPDMPIEESAALGRARYGQCFDLMKTYCEETRIDVIRQDHLWETEKTPSLWAATYRTFDAHDALAYQKRGLFRDERYPVYENDREYSMRMEFSVSFWSSFHYALMYIGFLVD